MPSSQHAYNTAKASMACPLFDLPDELQMMIVHELSDDDNDALINLSSTCRRYRSLLAPTVFRTITLKNTVTSATSVLAVSKSQHAQLVSRLTFVGTLAELDFAVDHDEYRNCTIKNVAKMVLDDDHLKKIIPRQLYEVLGNLTLFPNLHTLTVGFELGHWPGDPWTDIIDLLDGLCAYSDKGFDNNADDKKYTRHGQSDPDSIAFCRGYIRFCENLSEYFFDHLEYAETLNIIAPESGRLGHKDGGPLTLNTSHLPHLKFLYLEQIFITGELGTFLLARTDSLEELQFQDCYGTVTNRYSKNTTGLCAWHRIFDRISDSRPKRLERLEIRPWQATSFQHITRNGPTRPVLSLVENRSLAHETLESDPERAVFPYGNFRFGLFRNSFYVCDDSATTEFLNGDDQEAYDRLKVILEANKANCTAGRG
ncbi:hypothetical protein BU16DRAFT_604258 [Lophium mytilinum]|uniref:F-box domain-containing protein n=1 Tax=Lophium mytilinum TaxID=390894 RepID=A0A6A6R371_9PEZI|nr:hypothetical protein BU16DRAFT_604258 [Lophium mytilinum]